MKKEPIGKENAELPMFLLVPVIEGPEMDRMMEIVNSKVTAGSCGHCENGFGISWCNAAVPSVKYKITLSREF